MKKEIRITLTGEQFGIVRSLLSAAYESIRTNENGGYMFDQEDFLHADIDEDEMSELQEALRSF